MIKTENKPHISVVMSAYNAEAFLTEAIESILSQTFENFEFIIINDGSTDTTQHIIDEYARNDAHIVPIIQKQNKGLIYSLNAGFIRATGKYIARMDADDVSLPSRFQRQYDYLESHPDTVLLGTLSAYIDERGKLYRIWPVMLDDQEIRTELAFRNQFRHGTVMIRTSVILEQNEYYSRQAIHYEDYEYWPRLIRHGKTANLPEVLYLYRETRTNITATKSVEMDAGSVSVTVQLQKLLTLENFGIKTIHSAIRTSKIYRPAVVDVRGKRMNTNLLWCYQLHLIMLSMYYAKHSRFGSAAASLLTGICINPCNSLHKAISLIVCRLR